MGAVDFSRSLELQWNSVFMHLWPAYPLHPSRGAWMENAYPGGTKLQPLQSVPLLPSPLSHLPSHLGQILTVQGRVEPLALLRATFLCLCSIGMTKALYTHTYTHTHARIHIHTSMHAHTHAHPHTHMHMPSLGPSLYSSNIMY